MKRLLVTMGTVMILTACQQQAVEDDAAGQSASVENGNGTGTGTSGDKTGGSGGTTTPGSPNFNSAAYFAATIEPMFKTMCQQCHNGPRVQVPKLGPQTIYSFAAMELKLKSAQTLEDSDLWRKVTNQVAHTGGNVCPAGAEGSPCKEIAEWYKGIFGGLGAGVFGELVTARFDGTLTGWAINPADKKVSVEVEIYSGAPYDQGGKLIGSAIKADKSGFDNGNGAIHAFGFKVPEVMIEHGKPAKLYGYAIINGEKKLFARAPKDATMYVPKARAFFDSSVAGGVGGCAGCHGVSNYEKWYASLISPPPSNGGTAATNLFRLTTCGGNSHSGGNQCGGLAGGATIEQWWQAEFGP